MKDLEKGDIIGDAGGDKEEIASCLFRRRTYFKKEFLILK